MEFQRLATTLVVVGESGVVALVAVHVVVGELERYISSSSGTKPRTFAVVVVVAVIHRRSVAAAKGVVQVVKTASVVVVIRHRELYHVEATVAIVAQESVIPVIAEFAHPSQIHSAVVVAIHIVSAAIQMVE